MQRLFTTFPNSWPGAGLLLLRCILGSAPFIGLSSNASVTGIFQALSYVELVAGLLVLIGLWTPLAAVVLTATSIVHAALSPEFSAIRMLLGLANVSLAMLGPGAWSVDARLFGRKRLDVQD